MSKNHVPMHFGTGCEACDRRRVRLDRYRGRRAHASSTAGVKAALKAELARVNRAKAYANAQADPANGRPHRHEHGRRARLAEQRRRGNQQRALGARIDRADVGAFLGSGEIVEQLTGTIGLIGHLMTIPPRSPRVKNAYCAGLGHKWSGPRRHRLEGVPGNQVGLMRVCVRGSCHAVMPIVPATQPTAERRAL